MAEGTGRGSTRNVQFRVYPESGREERGEGVRAGGEPGRGPRAGTGTGPGGGRRTGPCGGRPSLPLRGRGIKQFWAEPFRPAAC